MKMIAQKMRGLSDVRIFGGIDPRLIFCLDIDSQISPMKYRQATALTSAIPRDDEMKDHMKSKTSELVGTAA
jgi:hypothetical protein